MAKTHGHGHRVDLSLDPDSFQPPSGYKPGTGHHGHQASFTTTREA